MVISVSKYGSLFYEPLKSAVLNSSCSLSTYFSYTLQAETRAEFAERSVAKLEKTIDDLEGTILFI